MSLPWSKYDLEPLVYTKPTETRDVLLLCVHTPFTAETGGEAQFRTQAQACHRDDQINKNRFLSHLYPLTFYSPVSSSVVLNFNIQEFDYIAVLFFLPVCDCYQGCAPRPRRMNLFSACLFVRLESVSNWM